jgi:periplasmic protein TonB
MASTVKEPDQQNSSVPVSSAGVSQPKVQPVALEISVTVNGARTVEGSDKREPFSETTQTVLVFGNGAVIRLNAGVAPGQLLFLTNEKTKKEVVCQVVKSKNYRSMSGYVELEFTEPAVGFWGMRFPSDRAVLAPATTGSSAAPVKPVSVESKPVPSAVQAKPVELPAPVAAPPSPAPVVAASLTSPTAEIKADGPTAVVSGAASIVTATADNGTEELKKQTVRLQEQLSSMMFDETPTPPPAPNKPILQLDAIAVTEETAKIFEMATPETAVAAKNVEAPVAPPTKISEQTNPAPVSRNNKSASFLQEQEVKIPAWLEPLARNGGTTPVSGNPATSFTATTTSYAPPAPPAVPLAPPPVTPIDTPSPVTAQLEVTELEDAQVPVSNESYSFTSATEVEPIQVRQAEAPNFGAGLFESNESVPPEPVQGGSKKGLWIGAIAATLLLAAGGGYWYMLMQGHSTAGTTEAATVSQAAPQTQFSSDPQQPAQNPVSASVPANDKTFSTPSQMSSQPATKVAPAATPATDVQKIASGRDSVKSTSASSSPVSHPAEPVAQPLEETRNPTFNKMRLAAPTVKSGNAQSISNEPDPGIALESEPNSTPANLSSGLVGSKTNQPTAPIPIGGDVTTVQLISSVPPVYPQMARSQRISGDVKIDALIDESGRVTSMKVVSGPVMLHQAAMDALHQWKYKPATLNGKPVSMHLVVTIQFRLQ